MEWYDKKIDLLMGENKGAKAKSLSFLKGFLCGE